MPLIYFLIGLYLLSDPLHRRGYELLSLLCMVPLGVVGLMFLFLCVATFCESLVEASTMTYLNPLYFPINVIVSALRGFTGGFFRISMLQ